MPLVMERGRIPRSWAGKASFHPARFDGRDAPADCLTIALVNNMPDSALEGTEAQFFELLDAASPDLPVRLKLYSLPKIPRSDRGMQHLASFYLGIDDLFNSRFDGVIVTGTEPRRPDLRDEPYWRVLTDVLDWAEVNTASTVLSCLAAHAGVLYRDGIDRHALDDKCLGVFDHAKVSDHALTAGCPAKLQGPHSRWNDVREHALTSGGYEILTKSGAAGVDLFVKQRRKSLFVHFQGHPEYGAQTLLREYRRDIGRFLRRERETYPSMPQGYFDAPGTKVLAEFRDEALANRNEEQLARFPELVVTDTLRSTWRPSAARIYRNWLELLSSARANTPSPMSVQQVP